MRLVVTLTNLDWSSSKLQQPVAATSTQFILITLRPVLLLEPELAITGIG